MDNKADQEPRTQAAEPGARKQYSAEEFDKNAVTWKGAIQSGRMTATQVIEKASLKGELSDVQKQSIQSWSSNNGNA
jgi:hypothetical protein